MPIPAISSHVLKIHSAREKGNTLHLQTRISIEQEEQELDIIDFFEHSLKQPANFYADAQEGNPTTPPRDPNEIIQNKRINLEKVIKKEYVVSGGTRLYKYLFFTVSVGEKGNPGDLWQAQSETRVPILADDYVNKPFHCFIAFPNSPQNPDGMLFLESRGKFGALTPLTKVLKKCVKKINNTRHTLEVLNCTDEDVVKEFIRQGKVEELHLITTQAGRENGSSIEFSEKKIIYSKPHGQGFSEALVALFSRSQNVSTRLTTNIAELDSEDTNIVKFVVGEGPFQKTYTVGRRAADLFKEEIPPKLIGADKLALSTPLLDFLKQKYEDEILHLQQ